MLTVGKENAKLAYTGNTLVQYGTTSTLKATVTEEADNSPGDISKAVPIYFDLYNESGYVKSYAAPTVTEVSPGVGSVSVSANDLPTDVYTVIVRMGGNRYYYAAPDSDATVLVVYDPLGGFVTGGGWILREDEKANFGFNVKYKDESTPQGELIYIDHSTGISAKSTSMEWMVVNDIDGGKKAIFKGTCTYNDQPSFNFVVKAKDYGEPGTGKDTFEITIYNPNSSTVYCSNGILAGGNIMVH